MNGRVQHGALAAARAALEAEAQSACLLDADLRFLAVNAAWDAFAHENGGGPRCTGPALLGSVYLHHVAGEVPRAKASAELKLALAGRQLGVESECNTAEVRRVLRTEYVPVRATDEGDPVGVLVVHTTVFTGPISARHEPRAPVPALHVDGDGLVTACSCCRRVRRVGSRPHWDFVPAYVAAPPALVSHGLCPACVVQYGAGPRDVSPAA